jgi:O-antigen chain-terminating methyltransferase
MENRGVAANPVIPESNGPGANARRLAELAALVDAVKNRVRNQYPESTAAGGASGDICVGLPDLAPLARARDAAVAKVASIGSVNPRRGGLVNNSIQAVKRLVARALNWFVRDQVVFNRQMMTVVETCIETMAEINRTIHNLAGQTNAQVQTIRAEQEQFRVEARALRAKAADFDDLASHWHAWREEWQRKLHRNEVQFLKSLADLNTSFFQKVMYVEAATQQRVSELQGAFERHTGELRATYERRAAELQSVCDQWMKDIQAVHNRQAGEFDESRKAAVQLERSFRDTLLEVEKSFETKVGQLESAYADQISQFDQRTSQLERDAVASLQAQHDDFERLTNANSEAIQKATAGQIDALANESRHAASGMEERLVRQARDFESLLATSITDVQKKFYADLDRIRIEYERIIHAELRIVRQRMASGALSSEPAKPAAAPASLPFDYARFADRFRGPEHYVTEGQRFYVPYFAGRRNVLDLGCGRGEFLKLMQEAGVPAKGIEAGEESVGYCRSLGLDATNADLFTYLSGQPEATLDGIFCSQVVEHLEPMRLPEMIRLCASRLSTGGILVIETPNPECLAIFATNFYLDPTHTRPVPPQLLAFYMEEFGLGRIEIHRRAQAVDTVPEVAELPPGLREKLFDGMDYAIIAYRL